MARQEGLPLVALIADGAAIERSAKFKMDHE